ncbi:hypothetical protein L596_030447 [Steinernema carpocapsae]|uniref:Peptidase S1 domain-containing protein n=1 Tax=Steinernema carpocapsae TaxID=34508 RepID=A0A4U5LPG8_STECR|nr:hypothetical protein L596_030447 [Steinernema carpocapsae]
MSASCFASDQKPKTSKLIFGGDRAALGQFPWQVLFQLKMLGDSKIYTCGGSFLTKRHVLTAAHCTKWMGFGSVAMLAVIDKTMAYWDPTIQVVGISSSVNHPDYVPGGPFKNDIAVVTLSSDVKLTDNVKPVTIKKEDGYIIGIHQGTVSGFGATNGELKTLSSNYLFYANVTITEMDYCRSTWKSLTHGEIILSDKQICSGNKGKGVGPGDSGGPLQVYHNSQWYQIGLGSFVYGNDEQMSNQWWYPAVFTRVAKYCDFVEETTRNEFKCV